MRLPERDMKKFEKFIVCLQDGNDVKKCAKRVGSVLAVVDDEIDREEDVWGEVD